MKSIFDKNANSFDLIRLLAALAVIYSHSYVWSGGAEAISRLTNVTHAGELSVVIFFFISGALVTKSLQRSSIMGYVIKRVARIYPALIICCFLVAFVMTWVFGGMSFTQVLNDPQVLKATLNKPSKISAQTWMTQFFGLLCLSRGPFGQFAGR